jgi:hypothetical protein
MQRAADNLHCKNFLSWVESHSESLATDGCFVGMLTAHTARAHPDRRSRRIGSVRAIMSNHSAQLDQAVGAGWSGVMLAAAAHSSGSAAIISLSNRSGSSVNWSVAARACQGAAAAGRARADHPITGSKLHSIR